MWRDIQQLQGQTLYTVKQSSPFQVLEVTDDKCIIQLGSTKKRRRIPKQEFERAFKVGPISTLSPSMLRKQGASEANPTYVLAILREINPLVEKLNSF